MSKPEIDPEALKQIREMQNKAQKTSSDILKLFNIDDFQADADKVEEVPVEGVGIVRFKRVVIADLFDLPEMKTRHEYTARLIYKMMSKADSNVTYEKICKLPPDVASRIFDVLAEKMVFLPQRSLPASGDGSTNPLKHKTSG